MDGLLVVDKPVGPTSHDIVAQVRRALGERRVGHTGTLDPAASGVLPLVIGRATRLARFLSVSDKTYEAMVRLGVATDTGDAQGVAVGAPYEGPPPTREAIERALDRFRGTFLQQPPRFSAKKIDGVRSYRRARGASAGPGPGLARARPGPGPGDAQRPAVLAPVQVRTSCVEVLAMAGPSVTLVVTCSAGFYVRSLAHDLGEALGTGAHLTALRRTRAGDLTLADAVALDSATDPARLAARMIPMAAMLPTMAAFTLTEDGERRVADGRDLRPADLLSAAPVASALSLATPPARTPVPAPTLSAGAARLFDRAGRLVAIAEPSATSGLLHPSIVLR